MIPQELKKQLDDFNTKFEKHCCEERKKLDDEISKYLMVFKQLDKELENKDFTILYSEEWLVLKKWIEYADLLIGKLNSEYGSRCVACQEWIEEKLKKTM